MAHVTETRSEEGTLVFLIEDERDGMHLLIEIPAQTRAQAEEMLARYLVRRDLEKDGYADRYQEMLDQITAPRRDMLRKAPGN